MEFPDYYREVIAQERYESISTNFLKVGHMVVRAGLDDNITTVSSQHVQNIITQIIITKFNITWNIITKQKSE
jgi:hypothetical protein